MKAEVRQLRRRLLFRYFSVGLFGAQFLDAIMPRANLQFADLEGADLRRANLQGADLNGANLKEADLRGTNLRGPRGLNQSRLSPAKYWELAFYAGDLLDRLGLPPEHNQSVRKRLAGFRE